MKSAGTTNNGLELAKIKEQSNTQTNSIQKIAKTLLRRIKISPEKTKNLHKMNPVKIK